VNRVYVGIDNGVTGSIGIILRDEPAEYYSMPVGKEQNYTKKKAMISRIDVFALKHILSSIDGDDIRVFIERPFVNPKGFKATASALRALEATLITVESLGLAYQYVDSKEWQRSLLPSGFKGKELKSVSKDIGIRLFPYLEDAILKQKDSDGILIAEWARRHAL